MQKVTNDSSYDNKLNEIFVNIVRYIYVDLAESDLNSAVNAEIEFDNLQRVGSFKKLLINGIPKMPTVELTESINKQTMPILSAPEKFWLKSLIINVQPGGKMNLTPTYIN